MADVDLDKVRGMAEHAEQWRDNFNKKYAQAVDPKVKAGKLNDYFYWAGKATSYRGIVAMCELATIVEDELDSEPTCP